MSLALFGGSFDPPHRGHLQSAQELLAELHCEQLALLPAAHSPLKSGHFSHPHDRLKMLELALQECGDSRGQLTLDSRELHRSGRSYTIDTLREVRAEIGDRRPLYWVMGSDSASGLDQWKEWPRLLKYSHLVVIDRAEQPLACSSTIEAWLDSHRCYKLAQLQASPAGYVYHCRLSQLAVSSTTLREKIVNGAPLTGWLSKRVADYIETHSLYR